MDTVNNMNKKIDITPIDSVCPIYRETVDPTQQALDTARLVAEAEAVEARAVARQAVLDRLGLTEQEAQLLLGS